MGGIGLELRGEHHPNVVVVVVVLLYYLSKWVLTTIVEDHVNNFVPMKFQDK